MGLAATCYLPEISWITYLLITGCRCGAKGNIEESSHAGPAHLPGGRIYSIAEDFDIDFCVKHASPSGKIGVSVMPGAAIGFSCSRATRQTNLQRRR